MLFALIGFDDVSGLVAKANVAVLFVDICWLLPKMIPDSAFVRCFLGNDAKADVAASNCGISQVRF